MTLRSGLAPKIVGLLVSLSLAGGGGTAWSADETTDARAPAWTYGGYFDLSYPIDFNFPENHRWRSKLTTRRVNQLTPNLVRGYFRKDIRPASPWGVELAVQGGLDPVDLAAGPSIPGADVLRATTPANVSYRLPAGRGLTVKGGIFSSYIGFESFYALENWNYTRSYSADYTPYFNMGFSAELPLDETFSGQFLVITGYNYLSDVNDAPSYGAKLAWQPTPRTTLVQSLYAGPDQGKTDVRFWRYLSDTHGSWRGDQLALGLLFNFGTEEAADLPGDPQTFWMSAAAYSRWRFHEGWAVGLRPEFYWDRNGRITGSEQLLRAVTATVGYRLPRFFADTLARLEYRWDESTGPGGGFFTDSFAAPGRLQLANAQHLLIFALIWSWEPRPGPNRPL